LTPQRRNRQTVDRTVDDDPGVIYQAVEPTAGSLGEQLACSLDLLGDGDVEMHRFAAGRQDRAQALRVEVRPSERQTRHPRASSRCVARSRFRSTLR
jgi:hypothetical protein